MSKNNHSEKMKIWQSRLPSAYSEWKKSYERMEAREQLYRGTKALPPMTEQDREFGNAPKWTPVVRNVISENIESAVSSQLPYAKVRAEDVKNEKLATVAEEFVGYVCDRLPFEEINDLAERTVRIQGGVGYFVEWDSGTRAATIAHLHPEQLVIQPGITGDIEDAEWVIVRLQQTRNTIKTRYGVDIPRNEATIDSAMIISQSAMGNVSDEMVTHNLGYYKHGGTVGLFSWVNETVVQDLPDYYARQTRHCERCGLEIPVVAEIESIPKPKKITGILEALGLAEAQIPESAKTDEDACPSCGAKRFIDAPTDYEEIWTQKSRSDGTLIPEGGIPYKTDDDGMTVIEPVRIPAYRPTTYPIIVQKSISVYGQFWGESDADKLEDMQYVINRAALAITERTLNSGTMLILPPDALLEPMPENQRAVRVGNRADAESVKVLNFDGDISKQHQWLEALYEWSRQQVGITDSFQGRKDSSAQSGVAKQFAAAQSASRLESQRQYKNAAYARIFEALFKLYLAYSDEPVVIPGDESGEVFSRWDFLERDADGEYHWIDGFAFSADVTLPLSMNREAMWSDMVSLFQGGAYGNPQEIRTRKLFWKQMSKSHYPNAGFMLSQVEREEAEQAQTMAMQSAMAQGVAPGMNMQGGAPGGAQAMPPPQEMYAPGSAETYKEQLFRQAGI